MDLLTFVTVFMKASFRVFRKYLDPQILLGERSGSVRDPQAGSMLVKCAHCVVADTIPILLAV